MVRLRVSNAHSPGRPRGALVTGNHPNHWATTTGDVPRVGPRGVSSGDRAPHFTPAVTVVPRRQLVPRVRLCCCDRCYLVQGKRSNGFNLVASCADGFSACLRPLSRCFYWPRNWKRSSSGSRVFPFKIYYTILRRKGEGESGEKVAGAFAEESKICQLLGYSCVRCGTMAR